MAFEQLHFRRATAADADAILAAHRDSIRSIGPEFYAPESVIDWQHGLTADVYRNAMRSGEVFFVACAVVDDQSLVLGFSSEYTIAGVRHGVSAYVRGTAARHRLGERLLAMAEDHARHAGAERIEIDASLAGVDFYRAQGYVETSRGHTTLSSGRAIATVQMYNLLTPP